MTNKDACAQNVALLNLMIERAETLVATDDYNDTGVGTHALVALQDTLAQMKRKVDTVVAREWRLGGG